MSRQHLLEPRFLETIHAILGSEIGTMDPEPNPRRVPGADRLTGVVLERRVAIEACRPKNDYPLDIEFYFDTDSLSA